MKRLNRKKQRVLIILSGITMLLFSGISCATKKNQEPSKPNIVFILTDDQAWNTLGRYGRYPFLKTPNIDRIADEGMVSKNAFCTTSLCSPSRASIMTGCYAHTNGVYVNGYADPDPKVPYLPTILQENGYETAMVGKWHMGHGDQPRKGFDYWLSFAGVGRYVDPPLNENGTKFIRKGYMTDILNDYALQWLKKPRNKPFCIFIWHKAPHTPFTPAPRDSDAFSDARVPNYKNWYDDMADKPRWMRRLWLYGAHYQNWKNSIGKPVPDKITPRPWDPQNPRAMNYLRTLLAVDKSVGEIRKYLEEKGILDNTVFIYSSDNGFFLGAHQHGDKRLMYEESLRIPLVIRYPKLIKSGSTNSNMVLNIDIAPTIVELAGGKVPEKMQGRSLVPLLRNENVNWRTSFLYEYYQEGYAPSYVTLLGVRNEHYKYIESPDVRNDIEELYDIQSDPEEMYNLIKDPNYNSVKSEMIKELDTLKVKTGYFDPKIFKGQEFPDE